MSLTILLDTLKRDLPILCVMLLLLASAVAVIVSKHASRSEFVVMQQLESQRDQLNEEWGRLLLEQSTWASPGRVERQARTKLNMHAPAVDEVIMVMP